MKNLRKTSVKPDDFLRTRANGLHAANPSFNFSADSGYASAASLKKFEAPEAYGYICGVHDRFFIHKKHPNMKLKIQRNTYEAPAAEWCDITAERGFSASETYPGGDAEPLDYQY